MPKVRVENQNGSCGAHDFAWTSPVPNALWLRTWRLGEWLNGPISPLFETFLVPTLVEAREDAGSGRFGRRLPRMWRVKSPAHCVINGYFFARAEPSRLSTMALPARFLASELKGDWTEHWESISLPSFQAAIARYAAIDIEATATSSLLQQLRSLALDVAECWYAIGLASGGGVPLKRFLAGLLRRHFADADILILLRGFHTKIMQSQHRLFDLALVARDAGLVGRPDLAKCLEQLLAPAGAPEPLRKFQETLRCILDEVGHQISTLDFVVPCLRESPSDLAVAIELYGRTYANSPLVALRKSVAERDAVAAKIREGLSPKKRRMFDRLLSRLHRYETVLDNTSFEMQRGWPIFRGAFLAIGDRLHREGGLETPADIFFLSYADVVRGLESGAAALQLASTARSNRENWRRQHLLDPPRCIPAPGDAAWSNAATWPIDLRSLCGRETQEDWTLRGIAASPGRCTGRARVCLTLDEAARLESGDILIAPRTTPNWTPLFSQVAAVVTDVGAATSHSSIIAREYRIPAVVGTQRATRLVKSGDRITVDGTAGVVHLQPQIL